MDDWQTVILGFTTTVVAAIVSAYFSARWATRKAFQERWWERKEQAYSEIVEALYDLIRYSELRYEEELDPSQGATPQMKQFAKKYSEAYWRIRRATDIGAFVISEESAAILEELQKRPNLKWDENPPWEIFEEESKHYRNALARIRVCARKDLRV